MRTCPVCEQMKSQTGQQAWNVSRLRADEESNGTARWERVPFARRWRVKRDS
ncbi:hypothetical protein [Bacillus carboniphilus]|uniref:hypothetical protein n=1 Tax=Bacillus carboniphilus TaxID=86663 RepID=UPI0031D3539F